MHKVTRESDEYVCSCGLRWGTDEDDPHPSTSEEHIAQIIAQIREKLKNVSE